MIYSKKYFKDYDITASITVYDCPMYARLVVRTKSGTLIRDTEHKNYKAAYAAWRRMCN